MAQRVLRFGIHDGAGRRAATWKLWTETSAGRSEVYLACRSIGGTLKTSLHESGEWHIAYSQRAFEEKVKGAVPKFEDRYIERWPRPSEIAPGITLAFRIVTPWSAVTTPVKEAKFKGVTWLPNAPEPKATEIDILMTKPTTQITGWPGISMGTSLIGSFTLENGETVWAVYWVVDMPDFSGLGRGTGRFFKGKNKKDLKKEGLKLLVLGTQPDGSRVIYDCAIKVQAANK
jgi:hypothetical protein